MSSNDETEAARARLVINPGTGAVPGATLADAQANIDQFVAQVTEEVQIHKVWSQREPEDDGDGRFGFSVVVRLTERSDRDVTLEVLMPGLPLEQVDYGARKDANVFGFPRLYLNGNSWLWPFAVDVAKTTIAEAVERHASAAVPPTSGADTPERVDPAEDMRRRLLPSAAAVAHATALLHAEPRAELAYVPMYLPGKTHGVWMVEQEVVTVAGIVLIAVNSFDAAGEIPSASWARDTATRIAREEMTSRELEGTTAYAVVRRNDRVSVFEDVL